MTWTTDDILEATGGERLCGKTDHTYSSISIDSRQIGHDALFIAIRGEVHDAHRFVDDAVKFGVRGLVIEKRKRAELPLSDWDRQDVTCIAVEDTTRALGAMAAFHRRRFHASVVAITGSTGKTTTREMMVAIVTQRYKTLSSRKNYNNEIGLPLTLFELNQLHDWAVIELGMNHLGEIARLTKICKPNIGVITNVGPVHLEGVGSIEGVMRAKGELLEEMDPEGTAVLNADDARVMKMAGNTPLETVLFGQSKNAFIRAEALTDEGVGTSFRLILPMESVPIHMEIPGKFMVSNALAAAAVGYLLGLSAVEIKTGLERFQPIDGRMALLETAGGFHIVNDAYNANPVSMDGAIRTLCTLKKGNRGILVMGDMLELGVHAESMHRDVGRMIGGSEIVRVYITGSFADTVASAAIEAGMDRQCIHIGTKDEIFEDLVQWLQPGDWILVKGSRAMGMEVIVNSLVDWGNIES
jgi:UDP-N-acetylmuramoyl-tripeptide--D-alanyl-D-alanine ligase